MVEFRSSVLLKRHGLVWCSSRREWLNEVSRESLALALTLGSKVRIVFPSARAVVPGYNLLSILSPPLSDEPVNLFPLVCAAQMQQVAKCLAVKEKFWLKARLVQGCGTKPSAFCFLLALSLEFSHCGILEEISLECITFKICFSR